MKLTKKILAFALAIMMLCSFAVMANASSNSPMTTPEYDKEQVGSITVYKYDITSAEKDGIDLSSYISDGRYNEDLIDLMSGDDKALGNEENETSNGYAVKGVEFSYLRVAGIEQYSEDVTENDVITHQIQVLYGFAADDDLLEILDLDADAAVLVSEDENTLYFKADQLNSAIDAVYAASALNAKNAFEKYMDDNSATAMTLTDENGKTSVDGLELGLYFVVETKVPEMVTSSTKPFFIALPMTTINGEVAEDGGMAWLYDVYVYPKNTTGVPSLEKTVREDEEYTGKNDGSDAIDDGYLHTATASDGDVVDYQIISQLPTITSDATALSIFTFTDKISKGIDYNQNSVVVKFYSDADCTTEITPDDWAEGDSYTVTFTKAGDDDATNQMVIEITEDGLAAINPEMSDAYIRITYTATVNSSAEVVYGEDGNPNTVTLRWQRTSEDFWDELVDDCHVYTFGANLTKSFSDGNGDMSKVEFTIQNKTDGYFVVAAQDSETGRYYVTGRADDAEDATLFVPTDAGEILVLGLEDDTYTLKEVQTASGYTLLKDSIEVVIVAEESEVACDIYESDELGVVNSHPHYLLTASATVDGADASMLPDPDDAESINALAPLAVINNRGFDLPKTGSTGTWMLSIVGILGMAAAAFVIVKASKRREEDAA